MKRRLTTLVLCTAVAATSASAGRIERACKASDRRAATTALCSCIERAAKSTLSSADRRLAAKFFKDPDLAQATRQSHDPRNERFWKRYKAFAEHAGKVCAKR